LKDTKLGHIKLSVFQNYPFINKEGQNNVPRKY